MVAPYNNESLAEYSYRLSKQIDAKWAINALLTWSNRNKPGNLVQVHRTNDKLSSVADLHVKGGGHFMIYSHANEINKIVKEILGYR